MKSFSRALLVSALSAPGGVLAARSTKMIESEAFVTPKRASADSYSTPIHEPYLHENLLLNLRQQRNREDGGETPSNDVHDLGHDFYRRHVAGGAKDASTQIITTSDIDNYFNLQITTKLWIGSEAEPHDLILDTGSMVSDSFCAQTECKSDVTHSFDCAVDLGLDKGLLELRDSQRFRPAHVLYLERLARIRWENARGWLRLRSCLWICRNGQDLPAASQCGQSRRLCQRPPYCSSGCRDWTRHAGG